ncbi:MAG: TolC family protein [Gammaproteobacteria bacterium]|nr:TolC family protein [Gammaproteobacteria bacterium]MCW8924153.1 TolC family protein [Gammaproteobacteria bacterium]
MMKRLSLIGLACLMNAISVQAQQPEPLPTPLTLDYVLELSSHMNPDFMRQQAHLLQAQAQQTEADAQDSINFDLEGRLGKREFFNEEQDYNRAALHMGLPLYDFGRTTSDNQAWLHDSKASEYRLQSIEKQFRLDLMRAYFDVLLADARYRIENEAMAIAYVTLDKIRDAHELGLASDTELYQSEENYQKALLKRQRAQADLRRLPMLLANAMGQPGIVVPDLELPELSGPPESLLELEHYLNLALNNNPEILAARQAYDASQYRIASAQAEHGPAIRADAWLGQLSSYPETREGNWHAEVSINIPLYDGGLGKSRIDRERAQSLQTRAEVFDIEQQVREQVMNLYFQLKLLAVERKAVTAGQDAADFNLDYKRALYENEQQTDLGDAMVRISQTHYDALEFDLKSALLWAKMQALTGVKNLTEQPKQESE